MTPTTDSGVQAFAFPIMRVARVQSSGNSGTSDDEETRRLAIHLTRGLFAPLDDTQALQSYLYHCLELETFSVTDSRVRQLSLTFTSTNVTLTTDSSSEENVRDAAPPRLATARLPAPGSRCSRHLSPMLAGFLIITLVCAVQFDDLQDKLAYTREGAGVGEGPYR